MNSHVKTFLLIILTIPLLLGTLIIVSSSAEARGTYLDLNDDSFSVSDFCYVPVVDNSNNLLEDQRKEIFGTNPVLYAVIIEEGSCSNVGDVQPLGLLDGKNYAISVKVTDDKGRLNNSYGVRVGITNVEHPTDSSKDCSSDEELKDANSECWKNVGKDGKFNGYNNSNFLSIGNGCACTQDGGYTDSTDTSCSEMTCYTSATGTKAEFSSDDSKLRISALIEPRKYCTENTNCYSGDGEGEVDYYSHKETCFRNPDNQGDDNLCTVRNGVSGSRCSFDYNCNFGLICVNNICSNDNDDRPNGEGCTANSNCQSGNCDGGICSRVGNSGDSCSNNNDCTNGLTCEHSICSGTSPPRPDDEGCSSNSDCKSSRCVDGVCKIKEQGTLGSRCNTDSNCNPGSTTCNENTNLCETDSGSGGGGTDPGSGSTTPGSKKKVCTPGFRCESGNTNVLIEILDSSCRKKYTNCAADGKICHRSQCKCPTGQEPDSDGDCRDVECKKGECPTGQECKYKFVGCTPKCAATTYRCESDGVYEDSYYYSVKHGQCVKGSLDNRPTSRECTATTSQVCLGGLCCNC